MSLGLNFYSFAGYFPLCFNAAPNNSPRSVNGGHIRLAYMLHIAVCVEYVNIVYHNNPKARPGFSEHTHIVDAGEGY